MFWDEEVEFTIDDNQNKCENCSFYLWIDSGYGFCRRFPPQTINNGKWWKPKWEIQYQLVEWCRVACGEFNLRPTKKKGEG